MSKFDVRVYREHAQDKDYLSVTHNGYQWNSIVIYNPKKEIPRIIEALEDSLKGIYRIRPEKEKP